MSFIELNNVTQREMAPGCRAKFVHGKNMTLSYWNLDPGAIIPGHSHPHEQVTSVIEGELEMIVDGETRLLHPGSVVVMPGYTEHSVKALTECYVVDAFHPVREDYR